MAINTDWHSKNKMSKNASMGERVRWHEEHARVCGCRPIPSTVRAAIEKKGSRR